MLLLSMVGCSQLKAFPDAAYGGGSVSGVFSLPSGDEGLRGAFEVPGSEDPAEFELDDCLEHGALLIRSADRAQSRVVACIELVLVEDLVVHSVPELCGWADFSRVRIDLLFDAQTGELETLEPLFYVYGRPQDGLVGWSVGDVELSEGTERSRELSLSAVEWIIDAPDCGWDLGTVSTGSLELAWDFDLEPRAEL
jgi:hypothetical protein